MLVINFQAFSTNIIDGRTFFLNKWTICPSYKAFGAFNLIQQLALLGPRVKLRRQLTF